MRYTLGLMLAAMVTVFAIPAQATDVQTQVTKGPFAQAFFTTAPTDEAPTPGVDYTDVYVYGSNQLTPDSGGVPVPFASIDVATYSYADDGTQVLVSDTFGGTFDNVTFTVDKRLATAALTATFDVLKQITPANPGGQPVAGGTVSITWTATERQLRQTTFDKVKMPGSVVYLSKDTVTSRTASASGSVIGTDYTNSVAYQTAIAKEVRTERLVTH
jgi:hypothetical protein